MKNSYDSLLKTWIDRLLEFQVHDMNNSRLDGGILCPACMTIHGRCTDLVYPLLYLADRYEDDRYKEAAVCLFDWGENLMCDDGSVYNDAQSAWNGITVFSVISLCEALEKHGGLLTEQERVRFEERLDRMGAWVYENLTMEFVTNINYHAAAAAAMALLGVMRSREDYKERARQMAASCLGHITEDGLLYGEGKPMERVTPRGCRPVDIGYNVEESIPELLVYARMMEDQEALQKVKAALRSHLDFMLPDGGWDNSFGTRNFKWTYWGSRTSDGCQGGYGVWGDEEPEFAEAAYRNLQLYQACTHDGLLYGGPDYAANGESPCIHHAFSHAKSLAAALDYGITEWERCSLPVEKKNGFQYYPTIDTWRIYKGPWIATVTACDFEYMKGGHATGGTLTMLWNKENGPVIASSMTEYSLFEAHNMQQSSKKAEHKPLVPRLEMEEKGKIYASCFDTEVKMEADEANGKIIAEVCLTSSDHMLPGEKTTCGIEWRFTEDKIVMDAQVPREKASRIEFVLPLIGEKVHVEYDGKIKENPVFFLAGGFQAREYRLRPDQEGKIHFALVCRK